jgi:hypothetical protein
MRRGLLLPLLVLALATPEALWRGWLALPDRYNPWAPLDVKEAPTPVTPWKFRRARENPELCAFGLSSGELSYSRVPDRSDETGCGFENAVRVSGSRDLGFDGAPILSCPMALAFAVFEEHVLQPAARRHLGQEVARIEHLGSYACRNLYGREKARRSEHASANAIDIAGFVLGNSRRVTVARDWGGDDAEGRFLAAVRDGACRFFNIVLGPEYNQAHRDHFHLDMGRFRLCR